MRILSIALVIGVLAAAGCREPQRNDVPDAGYAHALECLTNEGGSLEAAVAACSRRDFHPGSAGYASGWRAALECARGHQGSAADAASLCATG